MGNIVIFAGKDRIGKNVEVYFKEIPIVYEGKCISSGTLYIDEENDIMINFQIGLQTNEVNYIKIVDIHGISNAFQRYYGTILVSALFKFVQYIENELKIQINLICGELNHDDKKRYLDLTNGRRRLVDFYKDVIRYLPEDINKEVSVYFYKDKLAAPLNENEFDEAYFFQYVLETKRKRS